MKNKYGNYVLIKIIANADNEDKITLVNNIAKNLNSLNILKYRNKWLVFLEEYTNNIKSETQNQQLKLNSNNQIQPNTSYSNVEAKNVTSISSSQAVFIIDPHNEKIKQENFINIPASKVPNLAFDQGLQLKRNEFGKGNIQKSLNDLDNSASFDPMQMDHVNRVNMLNQPQIQTNQFPISYNQNSNNLGSRMQLSTGPTINRAKFDQFQYQSDYRFDSFSGQNIKEVNHYDNGMNTNFNPNSVNTTNTVNNGFGYVSNNYNNKNTKKMINQKYYVEKARDVYQQPPMQQQQKQLPYNHQREKMFNNNNVRY